MILNAWNWLTGRPKDADSPGGAPGVLVVLTIIISIIGVGAVAWQYSVMSSSMHINSENSHQYYETIFWVTTNVVLLLPALVTAVLAFLTFTLIRHSLHAVSLASRAAKAAEDQAKEAQRSNARDLAPFVEIGSEKPEITGTLPRVWSVTQSPSGGLGRFEPTRNPDQSQPATIELVQVDATPHNPLALSLFSARTAFSMKLRNLGRGVAINVSVYAAVGTWEELMDDFGSFGFLQTPQNRPEWHYAVIPPGATINLNINADICPGNFYPMTPDVMRASFQNEISIENKLASGTYSHPYLHIRISYSSLDGETCSYISRFYWRRDIFVTDGTIGYLKDEFLEMVNPALQQNVLEPKEPMWSFDRDGQNIVTRAVKQALCDAHKTNRNKINEFTNQDLVEYARNYNDASHATVWAAIASMYNRDEFRRKNQTRKTFLGDSCDAWLWSIAEEVMSEMR